MMPFNSTFKPKKDKPMLRTQFGSKRVRKCCICKTAEVANKFAKLCPNIDCVIAYGNAEREKRLKKEEAKAAKEARLDIKIRKDRIKPKADWLKEVQAIVNKYVRARDAHLGCVSCDKPPTWDGQWHASHYKSVGSNSALRYNLWNIHKSCSVCNNWKSGNLGEYAPRLAARIGSDRVQWLDNHPRSRDYDIEYLKRFKALFAKKLKRLQNRMTVIEME